MLSGNALRHQIILPQQQEFYDYWRSKCRAGQFPSRHDIRPEEICDKLPMISIMERTETGRYRFRLAGTGFWDLYNKEIQNRHLDEMPIGCRVDYWTRVLDRVVDTRKPYVGVTKPNTPNGSHLAQFWVRLPLSSDGETIDMILGFDHLATLSAVGETLRTPEKIYA